VLWCQPPLLPLSAAKVVGSRFRSIVAASPGPPFNRYFGVPEAF